MEVVRRLVRVDADVRGLHAVDRAVEALLVDVADGLRERLLEGGVEVVPELAAAADDVLPHPALRLVQRRGDAVAERRPLERGRDAVLVEAVPALVHRREDRRDVVVLVAGRQADVLRARAGRERVHGQVEPGERLVEAEAPDDVERVRVLRVDRPRAGQERVVAVDRADLGDQRDELRSSGRRTPPAPRPSSSRARSRRGGRRTARRSPRSSRCTGASARPRARGGGGRVRSRCPRAPWPRRRAPRRPRRSSRRRARPGRGATCRSRGGSCGSATRRRSRSRAAARTR